MDKQIYRTPHFIFCLLIFLITGFCLSPSQASFENTTQIGMEEKETKLMVTHVMSYSVSSDAFDNNDQKVFNHGLSYFGTFFYGDYYGNIIAGASYQSVDSDITSQDNGSLEFSDLALGLGTKGYTLYKGNSDSLSLFGNYLHSFPLSERSQNEGFNSISTASTDLAYRRGAWSLVLNGRYSYVFNSFETATDGLYNPRSSANAALTLRYDLSPFRFQFSYRAGVLEYMDGNRLGNSGNTLSILTLFNKNFWAGISTSNFSYLEEQFVDVWFYDPFRRIYNLRLGVTF